MTPTFCIHMMILPVKMNEIDKELQEATNWFEASKLSVNTGKTNYMLLCTRHGNTKYVDSVPGNKEIQVEFWMIQFYKE